MPPRRSRRLRRPSTQALESLAGSPRPRLWRDHTPGLNVTQVQSGSGLNIVAVPPGSGLNVPSVPSGSGLNAAAVPPGTVPPLVPLAPAAPPTLPQPVALPPELIAQLVTLVTTEVTKNIQAMLPTTAVISRSQQQNNGPNQTKTQSCTELPVVDAITEAGDTVQQVVNSAHSTLSGESQSLSTRPQLPSNVFTSVTLPVDAMVFMKLKTKIWIEEYIVFGALLVNTTGRPS